MATEKETASIAVLSTKVETLADNMKSLSTRFDVFQTNFIRSDVYTLRHEELSKAVAANSAEIRALKNFRWILIIAATAVGSLMTFLIIYALTHRTPV